MFNKKKKWEKYYDAANEISMNGRENYCIQNVNGFLVINNNGINILIRGEYEGFGRRIIVPYGIDVISFHAFMLYDNIEEVIIPDTVKAILTDAFQECRNLSSITIPRSVLYVGWGAFKDCPSLKTIYAPRGLETYLNYMTYDMENCAIKYY